MGLTFTMEPKRIVVVGTGDFTADDVGHVFTDIRRACGASPRIRILIHDRASSFDPSRAEVVRFVGLWATLFDDVPTRIALVVEKDVHFGIGRMAEAHADTRGLALKVFRDEPAAIAWLDAIA